MVDILPFRGIRYSLDEIERLVTPPYDVISEEERDRYYEKHENNVIRLILGKEYNDDGPEDNKYTRAKNYFENWLKEGILKQDQEPSIYVYQQDYLFKGEKKALRGFIALVKLEEFEKGMILPHEETLPEAIRDRFQLLKECRVNFSQIFTLYSDPEKRIDRLLEGGLEAPIIDIKGEDGIRHRVWKIGNPKVIEEIRKEMKGKKLFIADGHHRYSTALIFRDKMRGHCEGCEYTMMYLVNMNSGGATILPAHRLVRDLEGLDASKVLEMMGELFEVEEVDREEMFTKMENKRHTFGMYYSGRYYLLTLKDERTMDELFGERKSKAWKNLEVAVLRYVVIEGILGIKDRGRIGYEIDEKKVIMSVDEGEYQIAFFVNPTKVEEVRDVALAGERMPGKATYFYPKPLTGLVMNKLD
jgi:uncharacterized protein (DUF1015 family)